MSSKRHRSVGFPVRQSVREPHAAPIPHPPGSFDAAHPLSFPRKRERSPHGASPTARPSFPRKRERSPHGTRPVARPSFPRKRERSPHEANPAARLSFPRTWDSMASGSDCTGWKLVGVRSARSATCAGGSERLGRRCHGGICVPLGVKAALVYFPSFRQRREHSIPGFRSRRAGRREASGGRAVAVRIRFQNASASSSMTESAPALSVSSNDAVLGRRRRTKNRAVASFAR